MKKKISPHTVFKGCMLIMAAYLFCYVLSFFVTKMSYVKEYEYPQAYGRTTLEYTAAPVVKLIVWQKNDIPFSADLPKYRTDYYAKKELKLIEGETITFSGENAAGVHSIVYYPLTFLYDGRIAGGFDVKIPYFLYYERNDTRVPGSWEPEFTSLYDNTVTFEGVDRVTVGFPYLYPADYDDYYRDGTAYTPKEYLSNWIDLYETSDDFDFDRFFRTESLDDVYPDSPTLLHDFERNVLTLRLSFEAYDPHDSRTVIARGVIAVRYYSGWHKLYISPAEELAFSNLGYPNENYVEITVEEYKQWDRYSMR